MNLFQTTQWSLIDLVNQEAPTGSRENMGRLLEQYRHPMIVHLRYKGMSHDAAEDLVQDFILEILNKDLLAIADPKKGKFRTLLLTALDRFAITRRRYDTAAKRSPGELASLDAVDTDLSQDASPHPSLAFERAWALDVLSRALTQMQSTCSDADEVARWEIFESRVVRPLLDDEETVDYAVLAEQLSLSTDKAAMNLLVTAKRQFARIVRTLVREYVTRSADRKDHIDQVATAMLGEKDSELDKEMVERIARRLTEESIGEAVEDELEQLRWILSRSRSLADAVPDAPSASDESPQAVFWRRLNQRSHGAQTEEPEKENTERPVEPGGEVLRMVQEVRDLPSE